MTSPFRALLAIFAFAAGTLFLTPSAEAATITVCDSGCDYASLDDALAADAPGADTYILTTGYTGIEDGSRTLSDDTTLTCDPGVAFRQDASNPGNTTLGSNTLVHDCQIQDVVFTSPNNTVTNVSIIDNEFLPTALFAYGNQVDFGAIDNVTIRGNTGFLQTIRFNGTTNGLIENNELDCSKSVGCLYFTGDADSISAHNNVMTDTGNDSYDQVLVIDATNISFTSNTLQTVPVLNNGVRMMIIQGNVDNISVVQNNFIFPEHINQNIGGSYAIGIGTNDMDANIVIEQNSFISQALPSTANNLNFSCLEMFDSYSPASVRQVNITYRYNYCQIGQTALQDYGIELLYNPAYHAVNFTNEHNGFVNVDQVFFDEFGPLTSAVMSDTTLTSDPVFRTENANPLDDHLFVPMSRYLDVDGTRDIGYFDGGARVSTYTIDDDCTVNYTTCHSQTTDVLAHVLKSGDTVNIAAGTYPGASINGPVTNITLQGAGPTTVFDGSLNFQSALTLTNVTGSRVSDIRLINSTETAPIILSGYTMTLAPLTFGGNDYDDAGGVLFVQDTNPTISSVAADGDPVMVDGLTNINAFLFDLGGIYYTLLAPENVADSLLAMQTLVGVPPTHFIENMYIADGSGGYAYSSTNLDNQGITLKAGTTLPPTITYSSITTRSYTAAGLKLDDASENTFEDLLIETNDVGVLYVNGATDNVIENSVFDANAMLDIMSYSFGGTNDLLNSTFSRAASAVDAGIVRAIFDASIRIVDPLMAPLAGAGVNFMSANGLTNLNATTDGSGLTPVAATIAYAMTPTSTALTAGNYNPFTISVGATGPYAATSTSVTLSDIAVFEVQVNLPPVITPPISAGGGAGGLPTIDPRTGTYPPVELGEPGVATKPIIVKETRAHMLVKLLDDHNPLTQEDSTVYYLGADGKRHLFPNQSVFSSWYCDFSKVVTVDRGTLAKYPIGKNVTYRPGLNMVKFPTSPRVYVVQPGRVLRHIKDEAAAISLFGAKWAKLVNDLNDTTYADYVTGDELPAITDLSILNQSPSYPSGEMNIEGYLEIVTGGQECR